MVRAGSNKEGSHHRATLHAVDSAIAGGASGPCCPQVLECPFSAGDESRKSVAACARRRFLEKRS